MKTFLLTFLLAFLGLTVFGCASASTTTVAITYRRAEPYGSVPSKFAPLIENNLLHDPIIVEDSFFVISTVEDHYEITRYDFDFNQLSISIFEISANEYSYVIGRIIATKDGGFVYSVVSHTYYNSEMAAWVPSISLMIKCNSAGAVQWQREFTGYSSSILDFFIEDSEGYIFVFGTNEDDQSIPHYSITNVHAFKLNPLGQILVEKSFGGSDFDWVDGIELTVTGIVATITSQSLDGDFPVSDNGSGIDLHVTFDSELNLVSYQLDDIEENHSFGKLMEYEVYFRDGLIFFGDYQMQFEEGFPNTVIGFDDCFIIVSWNKIGESEVSLYVSYIPDIYEIVYSVYDYDLNLLWRAVVQPK